MASFFQKLVPPRDTQLAAPDLYGMENRKPNRREVLGVTGLALLAAQTGSAAAAEMQYRTLGKTGQSVSCLGLGGSHIGKPKLSSSEATRLIREALDRGMNFMDNSWDYNKGESEVRMGNALRDGYRQKAFLMTKFDGRTKESAMQQIDESLKRLQTDHLDVLQFHETIRFDDPDRFFAPDGAHEALVAAKQAGKTRFIGFTGHKDPHIHLYMLELAEKNGFHFDTIQFPVNIFDAQFRSFGKLVIPKAQQMGLGILCMKSIGSGVLLKSNVVTAEECLRYSLTQPVSVVITGIDSQKILDQAFHVASGFKPMSETEISSLMQKTASAAASGKFELFKTTAHFDSTAQHPEWLGPETPQVKQFAES